MSGSKTRQRLKQSFAAEAPESDNNVIFAETVVEPGSIQGESRTPDAIVEEALKIKNRVETSGIDFDDDAQAVAMVRKIQKKHKDFYESFPLVVRWLCQVGEFREDVFRAYLERYKKKMGATGMWKTRGDFLENQADYLTLLLKSKKSRLTAHQIREYRGTIIGQLEKEDKDYKEANKEAEEKMKEIEEAAKQDRRDRLINYVEQARARKAAAAPNSGAPTGGSPTGGALGDDTQ